MGTRPLRRAHHRAQLQNDKVDALHLAQLLRLDMIPRAHAASPEARHVKGLVRQRACRVGIRTRIRNRTHRLLGGISGGVNLPQCSDLFGTRGTAAMSRLKLPPPHDLQLAQNLAALGELQTRIAPIEKDLEARCRDHPDMKLLKTIPGLGKVLASVIASEIDGIGRFPGYCGLAPGTYGSVGKFNQGRMISQCNRWLKWAFIEAAWVAIGCDGYFGSLYKRQRDRGKKANTAITIVVHRLAQIAWELLVQRRAYRSDTAMKTVSPAKNFPARSEQGLVGEPG